MPPSRAAQAEPVLDEHVGLVDLGDLLPHAGEETFHGFHVAQPGSERPGDPRIGHNVVALAEGCLDLLPDNVRFDMRTVGVT